MHKRIAFKGSALPIFVVVVVTTNYISAALWQLTPHRHHLRSVGDACLPAPLWSSCLPSPSHRRMSILCRQTWRGRVTCVLVKSACVCVCRWLSATCNVSVMLSMTMTWVFFGGEGKTRTAPPLYQLSFPASPPPSIPPGCSSTSRPADGSLPSPNHSSALFLSGWVAFTVKTLPYTTSCRFPSRGVTITQPSGCRRFCLTTSPISHLVSVPPPSRTRWSCFFCFF